MVKTPNGGSDVSAVAVKEAIDSKSIPKKLDPRHSNFMPQSFLPIYFLEASALKVSTDRQR